MSNATLSSGPEIRRLNTVAEAQIWERAELPGDCVDGGANAGAPPNAASGTRERVAAGCRGSRARMRLYARLGWRQVGVIPGYALLPHGGLCDTHYFYRSLL